MRHGLASAQSVASAGRCSLISPPAAALWQPTLQAPFGEGLSSDDSLNLHTPAFSPLRDSKPAAVACPGGQNLASSQSRKPVARKPGEQTGPISLCWSQQAAWARG